MVKHAVCSAAVLVVLGACSILDPAKFDAIEYGYYAQLYQQANRLQQACGHPERVRPILTAMFDKTELLGIYVHYQPDPISKSFADGAQHLLSRFDPYAGETFCVEASRNLQDGYARARQVLGGRAK